MSGSRNPFTTRIHGLPTPGQSMGSVGPRNQRSSSQCLYDFQGSSLMGEVLNEEPSELDPSASMAHHTNPRHFQANEPVRSIQSPIPDHYNRPFAPQYHYHDYTRSGAHARYYSEPRPSGHSYRGTITVEGSSSILQGNLYDGSVDPRCMKNHDYSGEVIMKKGNTANFIQGDANAGALDKRGFWNGSKKQRASTGTWKSEQQVPPEDRWWENPPGPSNPFNPPRGFP